MSQTVDYSNLSVVIPAKNEQAALDTLLGALKATAPGAEVLIVNDGSTDETAFVANKHGVNLINHPYSIGNGGAIKTGARHANREFLVFMDADGQHQAKDISRLLHLINEGYDMVIGTRHRTLHASIWRAIINSFYNIFASWVSGRHIEDLTSGFRAVNGKKFKQFLHLLPNGFSYPTTITMAFLRAGYTVAFTPIDVKKREGASHIKPVRDGFRFLLIIFRIGTLYSPLKIFTPIAMGFMLSGLGYYIFTYVTAGRFTNMSAVLFISAIIIFLIGLVSEQITMLTYRDTNQNDRI